MDPLLAILSWLCVRGSSPGPVFCDVTVTVNHYSKINCDKPWSAKGFKDFLRSRLNSIGVGPSDCERFSGHSIKRGSVQLYRSLGVRDEMIMEIIQMTGNHAYANYCAAYNDCAPEDIPRFTSITECILHAEEICREKSIMHNDEDVERFILELDPPE